MRWRFELPRSFRRIHLQPDRPSEYDPKKEKECSFSESASTVSIGTRMDFFVDSWEPEESDKLEFGMLCCFRHVSLLNRLGITMLPEVHILRSHINRSEYEPCDESCDEDAESEVEKRKLRNAARGDRIPPNRTRMPCANSFR